jgi:hypothetical protein
MAFSGRAWTSEDWERCGPDPLHPIRVIIVEAMLWIDEPLSARTIEKSVDGAASLALIAYHLRRLAALSVVEKSGDRVVKGAVQVCYRLCV